MVDDHKGFGQRLARMLRKWGKPAVVTTVPDAVAAIGLQRWAALFIDAALAAALLAAFRLRQPFTPALVLSAGAARIEMERAWSLGARCAEKPDVSMALVEDFLRSGSVLEAQLAAMSGAHQDETQLAPDEPEVAAPPKRSGLDVLSYRECQVLTRKVRGEESKAIACHLGLAESTVRVLLSRAAAKLRCASRRELLEKAAALTKSSSRKRTLG